MTLTITLKLSPEKEEALRRSVDSRDREQVRQLLVDALEPTIDSIFQKPQFSHPSLSMEAFDALMDELLDFIDEHRPADAAPLSDYALSREGIYGDHP